MKVTLNKDYRTTYTLEELEQAKRVIANTKGDEATPKDYAELAVKQIMKRKEGNLDEVLTATAETIRNQWRCGIDRLGDDTGYVNVVINFTAKVWTKHNGKYQDAFIEGMALLTDIWEDIPDEAYFKRTWFRLYYQEA